MSYKKLSNKIKQLNEIITNNTYNHETIQQTLTNILKANTVFISNNGTIKSKTYALTSVKINLFTKEDSKVERYIFDKLKRINTPIINLKVADLINESDKQKKSTLAVIPLMYKSIQISWLIVYFECRNFTKDDLIILTLAGQMINQLLLTSLCLRQDIRKAIYDYDTQCYSRLINNCSKGELEKTNQILKALKANILYGEPFSITQIAKENKCADHKRHIKQWQLILSSGLIRYDKDGNFVISQVIKDKYDIR